MKVKILKKCSFALDGKFVVHFEEGEVRELSDAQGARLIQIKFAEYADTKDEVSEAPLAEKDPEAEADDAKKVEEATALEAIQAAAPPTPTPYVAPKKKGRGKKG